MFRGTAGIASIICSLFLLFSYPETAGAQSHVALVFGNSDYKEMGRLRNPSNDAEDLSARLVEMGYEVETVFDATYTEMRVALSKFTEMSRRADVALVYFAGHGIEVERQNYLIPTDATLKNDNQVAFQTIPLTMMQNAVDGARKLKVILLDSCRDNPFLAQMQSTGTSRRSTMERGMAPISLRPNAGIVVSYAAKAGTTASDGDARNSPYAAALLNHLTTRNLEVNRLFRKVRDEVVRSTNGLQVPDSYESLPAEDLFLHPGARRNDRPDDEPAGQTPKSDEQNKPSRAKLAWEAVRDTNDAEDLRTFLALYPDSVYADFARVRLKRFSEEEETVVVSDPPPERWYLATYANLDLFGGDIIEKGVHSSSSEMCAQLCGDDSSCRAFTFNAQASKCFLKRGFEFAQVFEGASAGLFFRATDTQSAPVMPARWEVFSDSDLDGTDMYESGARTYSACLASCEQASGCRGFAFVYYTKRNQCYLKTGATHGPVRNRNALRGIVSARRIDRNVSPVTVLTVDTAQK